MVDDIVFGGTASVNKSDFILETPAIVGGNIVAYSLDGKSYDYKSGESISVIIN